MSTLCSLQAQASPAPPGYRLYVGVTPSDDLIYVKDGTYLLQCFSRHGCEKDYYYGGTVKSVGTGIVRTSNGGYYCSKSILPKGMTHAECTPNGFAAKQPIYP